MASGSVCEGAEDCYSVESPLMTPGLCDFLLYVTVKHSIDMFSIHSVNKMLSKQRLHTLETGGKVPEVCSDNNECHRVYIILILMHSALI